MKIYNSLTEIPTLKKPISLLIGMFDGVHKGHQHLLKQLASAHGSSCVLTFNNHPLELLKPNQIPPLLTSRKEKLLQFNRYGVKHVITLDFTKDIAEMTYQMFLQEIHRCLPFNYLYRGEGDAFGKNREGTEEAIKRFAPSLKFTPHYIKKYMEDDKIVSSSRIRKCLLGGDILEAENLLGRPLSFSSIDKDLLKPGSYKVRILEVGEEKFSEEIITIHENKGYTPKKASTITFITDKG